MALPSLLISSLNGILSTISETGVLVLGVYYKLQSFIYLSANGVIQGMRPILSFNHGACEKKRVRSIYLYSLGTITVLMSIGTLICYLIPTLLMGLFTSQEETIFLGSTALRIISCGFIFSSISVTSSGALEALGHGIQSLIISLMRYVILILPMAFILSKFLGMNGVWHAFWITEIITAFVAFSLIRKRV